MDPSIILSAIVLLSAVAVVALRNPIHSALNLVVAMLGLAGIYAMLGAHFLAAVQVILYAGAVVVLILFVLMLLNLKVEQASPRDLVIQGLAVVSGVSFLAVAIPSVAQRFGSFPSARDVFVAARGPEVEGTVKNIGALLYDEYLLPFEVASVLIMAALVGAVLLGKRRRDTAK